MTAPDEYSLFAWRVTTATPWTKWHVQPRGETLRFLCGALKPLHAVAISSGSPEGVDTAEVCGGCQRERVWRESRRLTLTRTEG